MSEHLRPFTIEDLFELTSARQGETKVGQRLRVVTASNSSSGLVGGLREAAGTGARFGLVLVPEDVGPRANCGRPGADGGPAAFIKNFANLQDNRFLSGSSIVAVGEVKLGDVMERAREADLDGLRGLCAEVDERVQAVVQLVFASGLEPIVVGGGNNNSLPILRALHAHKGGVADGGGVAVLNCDPHADFRRTEDGRHSGNPFSFAHKDGILKRYCVFGLHESYNSEDMIARLDKAGYKYFTYESSMVRGEETVEDQIKGAIEYLDGEDDCGVGVEVDLDSIVGLVVMLSIYISIPILTFLKYQEGKRKRMEPTSTTYKRFENIQSST